MGQFSDVLFAHEALQQRKGKSLVKLGQIRTATASHDILQNTRLSVFAAGSLGRLETGERSDFDVFMIADSEQYNHEKRPSLSRLEEYEVFAALIRINEDLKYPRFSGDGRFLKTYELRDLIKATGSPQDDSENLFTARMLLLLESQCITNEPLYQSGTSLVVDNYYRDGLGRDNFHPLFLLNDVLRYWRTLCLNYEVYRNDPERGWLKKNLNLKFSRKLTTFSTVLSLLTGQGNDRDSFIQVCCKTPIERLAGALDSMDDRELDNPFRIALDDYEAFLHAKETNGIDATGNGELKRKLTAAAERFGSFFHQVLESKKLDAELRRYILV